MPKKIVGRPTEDYPRRATVLVLVGGWRRPRPVTVDLKVYEGYHAYIWEAWGVDGVTCVASGSESSPSAAIAAVNRWIREHPTGDVT